MDNFSPHLSTKKDSRVGDWAAANNVKLAWAAGLASERLTLDFDATLVNVRSEKEGAAATNKGEFGFHPLLVFLDLPAERTRGEADCCNRHHNLIDR